MISSDRYCASCGAANASEAETCFACGLSLKITAPLLNNNRHLLQQRYRILSQVGRGGFSAVYKAEDTLFDDHPVAIKAISLNGLKPHEVIEATEAFNREMMVLPGLKHPNLPRIYNHFADSECWYLVMDFIEGTTLEKHLEKMHDGRLPVGEVLEVGLLLCSVLEYLHTRQPPVIFRDLKPANIMLTSGGRIALIDFGIARHFKPGQAKDTMPFGSPGYAAPEQYGKAQTTPRSDIYGLGVLLHQLLTGDDPSQSPFRFAPLQVGGPAALDRLEPLIRQMMELDTDKRPGSITVVKDELQRIAHAWFAQHAYGLQAQVPQWAQAPYQPASLPLPPPQHTAAVSIATNSAGKGQGQMIVLQQPAPGMGSSSFSSAAGGGYWSMPKTRQNKMAIASLTLGIISIFIPLVSCMLAGTAASQLDAPDSRFFFVLPVLFMLSPAILAVIFGHIGKHRANTVPGWQGSKDMAVTGMVIGYIFGFLYLGAICLLLSFFMSFR